jgi:hypothetical protein
MIDNRDVGTSDLHEEERESRYEAAPAVVLVIALQVVLALVSIKGDRRLIGLPGWVWLIPTAPEAGLLLTLTWSAPRHRLEQRGVRRSVALTLAGVITAANALALVALIASLVRAEEQSGGELLLKGATIWATNVITFGRCGGRARRRWRAGGRRSRGWGRAQRCGAGAQFVGGDERVEGAGAGVVEGERQPGRLERHSGEGERVGRRVGVKGAIAGGEGDGSGEGAGVVAAGVAAGALTTWVRVGDVLALLLASPA